MQAPSSLRATDTRMTPLLACLFSEASADASHSTGKERDAQPVNGERIMPQNCSNAEEMQRFPRTFHCRNMQHVKCAVNCSMLVIIGLCIFSYAVSAQTSQDVYDSGWNSQNSQTGVQPFSSLGTLSQNVNQANGNVALSLPLLHLPGVREHDLDLRLNYDSKNYDLDVWANPYEGGQTGTAADFGTYNVSLDAGCTGIPFAGGTLSIPVLCYVNGWIGLEETDCTGGIGGEGFWQPITMNSHWVYIDETGAKHSFPVRRDRNITPDTCTARDPNWQSFQPLLIADSADNAFLQLNASNLSDVTVTRKDGSVVHFSQAGGGCSYGGGTCYTMTPSKIVDIDGNTITLDASNGIVITDTVGRTVTINLQSDSVSYRNSQGQTATISATSTVTQGPSVSVGAHSCTEASSNTSGAQHSDPPPLSGSNITTWTIQNQSGSVSRNYQISLDTFGEPTEIVYPGGGTTTYEYQNFQAGYTSGSDDGVECSSVDYREVVERDDCPLAGGSCSAPAVTSYQPTISWNGINSSITVTHPLLPATGTGTSGRAYDIFKYAFSGTNWAGFELSHQSYAANGTLLRTVSTTPELGGFNYGTGDTAVFPNSVTTTYNDISPALSFLVQTDYDSMNTMTYWPAGQASAITVTTDNPSELRYYDFSGGMIKKEDLIWEKNGTLFSDIGSHILNALQSSTVTDSASGATSATTYGYDSRGNVSSKVLSGSGAVPISLSYNNIDSAGRPTSITDGRGYTTTFHYTNTWSDQTCAGNAPAGAYLTSEVGPTGVTRSHSYNSCTGTLGWETDPNGNVTAYAYDPLDRIAGICTPDAIGTLWTTSPQCSVSQATSSTTYTDSVPNSITRTQQRGAGLTPITTISMLDGFSRETTRKVTSDPQGPNESDTTYDALGRVSSATNTYYGTPNGSVRYFYDAFGRKTEQIQADGSSTLWWCFDNTQDSLHPQPNCHGNESSISSVALVDSSDENGNDRQAVSDALDRLRGVVEPGSLETDYSYDGFGNVLSVNQKGTGTETARQRSFTYTGLSQLVTATSPETGTVCYGTWNGSTCGNGYDADGNLLYKSDARGVVTNYSYDSLNRLLSKSYSSNANGTSLSCFQYDSSPVTNGIGRMANEWTLPASAGACPATIPQTGYLTATSISAYDPVGRVWSEKQCTPSGCRSVNPCSTSAGNQSFAYDLAGNLTCYGNGVNSALSFTQGFDAAGRLQSIGSNLNGSLFTAQSFWPQGAWQNAVYGTVGGNGVTLSRTYDNRLRLTGETDTGQVVQNPVPGSTMVTITGQEQSH